MALSIITDALGRRGKSTIKDVEDWADVLEAVQRVTDTLTPPKGGRYVVALKDATTAYTELGAHRITITSRPLRNSSISQALAAEIMTGLVSHEIGHTIFDADDAEAIRKHNPHPAYARLSNLLGDHRLETRMRVRYPMIGPAFTTMLRWVAEEYGYEKAKPLTAMPVMRAVDRFNFATAAIRYARHIRWSNDPMTRAERRRWREWAETYIENDSLALHLEGLDVAFAWLDEASTPEPEDEPEDDEPEDEPSDERGESNPGDDEDDESEDDDEGGTQPGDDWDDDDDADVPPDGWDDDDESEDGESKPKRGESKDDESEDADEDGGSSDDEDDEDEDGESKPDERNDGGHGPQTEDWDESTIKPDVHEAVKADRNGAGIEDAIAKFNATSKVTFGAYGTMSAEWS